MRGFIRGTLYTNNLGFNKFFPCSDETSEQTCHTLKSFVELVVLPHLFLSDNHNNFKEGLFKRLLKKWSLPDLHISTLPVEKPGITCNR